MKTFLSFLLLSCCFFAAAERLKVKMGYPEFPPFTFTDKQRAAGLGIEKLRAIANAIKLDVEYIPVASYGKGVSWLTEGKIDGLMLASKNKERDKIAKFSEAVMLNRWVWFTPKGSNTVLYGKQAKQELRVITHTKANTHTWLNNSGYKLVESTTDVNTMIRLLMNDRVDAVFLAEMVFLETLKSTRWNVNSVTSTVELSQPFGVYLSHKFLAKHTNLMPKLNAQLLLNNHN